MGTLKIKSVDKVDFELEMSAAQHSDVLMEMSVSTKSSNWVISSTVGIGTAGEGSSSACGVLTRNKTKCLTLDGETEKFRTSSANPSYSDVVEVKTPSQILKLVIDWLKHQAEKGIDHQGFCKNPNKLNQPRNLNKWEKSFLDIDIDTLFQVIMAAENLDICCLINRGTKKLADLIVHKNYIEMRSILHVKGDFTRAEEEQLLTENEWLQERLF